MSKTLASFHHRENGNLPTWIASQRWIEIFTRNEVSKTGKRPVCAHPPPPPPHTHTLVEARPLEIDFKLRSLQGPWWRCSIRRPGVPTIRGSRNVGKTGWETGDDGWWVGGWWWWRYRQFLLWNVSDDSVYRVKLREISFFRDVWLC